MGLGMVPLDSGRNSVQFSHTNASVTLVWTQMWSPTIFDLVFDPIPSKSPLPTSTPRMGGFASPTPCLGGLRPPKPLPIAASPRKVGEAGRPPAANFTSGRFRQTQRPHPPILSDTVWPCPPRAQGETLLPRCCDLLRRCCDVVATLLRRCCDVVVTLLWPCCDDGGVVGTLLRRCCASCEMVATLL